MCAVIILILKQGPCTLIGFPIRNGIREVLETGVALNRLIVPLISIILATELCSLIIRTLFPSLDPNQLFLKDIVRSQENWRCHNPFSRACDDGRKSDGGSFEIHWMSLSASPLHISSRSRCRIHNGEPMDQQRYAKSTITISF